jgi:hypothetical protein
MESKPRKAKKRPRKRGPKEERLVIREDPEEALQRLFRPKSSQPKTRHPTGGK